MMPRHPRRPLLLPSAAMHLASHAPASRTQRSPVAIVALLAGLLSAVATGCATRTATDTVVDVYGLEVVLRSEKPMFGGKPVERDFDHPISISPARAETILGGIQVDMRESEDSLLRERRYAIPRKVLPQVAAGLSEALAQAGPDQEVVVRALRKQVQKGIFSRKYLTSFVAYAQDGLLYVHLSRIDWKTDEHRDAGNLRTHDGMPWPNVGEYVMPFSTVESPLYALAGRQGVRIDWKSAVFGADTIEDSVAGTRAGAATDEPAATRGDGAAATGTAGPSDEPAGDGADARAAPDADARTTAGPSERTPATGSGPDGGAAAGADAANEPPADDVLRGMSAEALRQLADLEEARDAGRIDEAEYEARRRAIFEAVR